MPRIVTGLAGAIAALALLVSAALAQPIAVAEGEQDGVRIEVTELKRTTGDTVTMRLTLINDRPQRFDVPGVPGFFMASRLVDLPNRLTYGAVHRGGSCLCGGLPRRVEPGESVNAWARFVAPPPAVREVSLLFPGFLPVDGVPISE